MRLLKKILVATTVLSVALASLPVGGYQAMAEETVDVVVNNVTYAFTNNNAGYADGLITVTSNADAEFELYWGNSSGTKLQRDGVYYSSLGTVTTVSGKGTYDIISPYTAIPAGATKLLVYNGDEKEYTYSIPANKVFNKGAKKYSFGIMSDIHYSRYYASGSDDANPAFNKALTFMEKKAKVSFVAGLGDLSNKHEDVSFQNYTNEIAKHNITMYTVMGNHDVYNDAGWKKYVNTGITKDKNILDIADNGIDFVYKYPGAADDVFIFLSQIREKYYFKTINILLDNTQLYWIEEMLAKYANKNVFLMFHTFVATNTGDGSNCVGNLKNPGGYTYDLPYTVGTPDEVKMKALLNKYPNVTMFSGHSHWSYSMQKYNPNLNIGQLGTGARLVHVSSVTEPRVIGTNDTSRTGLNNQASEGMLADVYSSSVVYTGVDFWNGEYLAYATYISENGKKGTAEVIKVAKAKIKSATKTSKKSKKAKIKIKTIKNVKGYEIQYSTSKKFKAKKTKVKTTKKTTVTIKKLKAKKTYYVRVRAYIEKYGKTRYGKWSKTKKIKVKKK